MKIIRVKDEENQRIRAYYEMQALETKMLKQNQEEEKNMLREKVSYLEHLNLQ